ncbi:fatty acid desaturase [bacterium]|nr:fatty acid desaturase [bacterium]
MSKAFQGSVWGRLGKLEEERHLTGKYGPGCRQRVKRTNRFKRPKLDRGLTAYLFFPAASGVVVFFAGLVANVIPWWLNLMAALPLYWYCYMTAHDAVHRAAHQNQVLNNWVGWISSGLFGLPFSLMRRAHLSHHCNAGRKDDIERFAYVSGWQLPFGVILGNLFFYAHFPKCNFKEKLSAAALVFVVLSLIFYFPQTMLLGWILPMQLVFGLGMFTNIYLPHGPYAKWVEEHVPFVTGFHEDHHAMPSYPWHQLCRREIRFACRQKRDFLRNKR